MVVSPDSTSRGRHLIVRNAPIACGWFVSGVFATLGLLKLIDLPAFALSLASFESLPSIARRAALLMIPSAEVALAGLFIAGVARRAALVMMLFLLLAFTSVLIVEMRGRENVACGCLGLLSQRAAWLDHAEVALWRNGLLMLICVLAIIIPVVERRSRWSNSSSSSR